MWEDVTNIIHNITPWQNVAVNDAEEMVHEALRHCPEFPFDPASVATQQKSVPFYDSSLFTVSSLKKGDPKLVKKLKEGADEVTKYLRNELTPDTIRLLDQYIAPQPPDPTLLKGLADGFNKLLKDPTLYQRNRFSEVQLSEEINNLIKQKEESKGAATARLNRLLIEAAYHEIVKHRFYNDYRLVRFIPATNDKSSVHSQEIYGFYTPGDFRPIDGTGRAIELLNNVAPLHLTSETVMEYVLLRLKIELPFFYADSKTTATLRTATIVKQFNELPIDKKKWAELEALLTEPNIVMIPEWDTCPGPKNIVARGKVFRVSASVVVYHEEDKFELIKVFAQVTPDGLLSLSKYNKRSDKLTLNEKDISKEYRKPEYCILFPHYTRTALPIREWQSVYGNEAEAWCKKFVDEKDDISIEFDASDLRNSISLGEKLRDSQDPLSKHLQTHFQPNTQQLLKACNDFNLPSESFQNALLDELNRVLNNSSLFDDKYLAHVKLSDEAQVLLDDARSRIAQSQPVKELRRLKRLLLEEAYPHEIEKQVIVFRKANLSFYRNYDLLEVLIRKRGSYQRNYYLIHNEKQDMPKLDGQSMVIHRVNGENNELILTKETVNEYLRFFCWAIRNDGYPFYIPWKTFREIPLLSAPSVEQRIDLEKLDFTISSVGDSEAERLKYPKSEAENFRRKAHVAFKSGVFEAWFNIESTGMVTMIDDEPYVTDLTISKGVLKRDETERIRN